MIALEHSPRLQPRFCTRQAAQMLRGAPKTRRNVGYIATIYLSNPPNNINEHWSLYQECLVLCWLSELWPDPTRCDTGSLWSFSAPQYIPVGSEYNDALLVTRRELYARSLKDYEVWWSQRGSELEPVANMGNSRKLFHLT